MNTRLQWMRENIYFQNGIHKNCEGCEDEVNCKGHLTKPQEAVYVENVKKDFQL